MNVQLDTTALARLDTDALLLPYPKNADSPAPWDEVDEALGGAIAEALSSAAFSGDVGRCLALPSRGAVPARDVILVGTGEPDGEVEPLEAWRRAVAAAVRVARRRGATRAAVGVAARNGTERDAVAAATAEAIVLGAYRFTRYKSPEHADLEVALVAVGPDGADPAAVARALTIARATCWARDLINESPSRKRPPDLAETAREMAEEVGLAWRVIDAEEAEEIGLRALLAVGGGSTAPPQLVALEHLPEGAPEGTVLLVGKGVTFDTGGISIKPSTNMDAMKGDMSGAAAVLATMRAVAELALPLRVVGITPLAENMPDGTAYRPGDIVRAYSSKTIEVLNTDAEGRLILADALAWGRETYEPACIVDLATLTGAAVVALGDHVAAVMSGDDDLAAQLIASGDRTGDRIWRLPVWGQYRKQIESHVADIKNTGGRPGGAITAGKFLQEFVGDTVWAHLDIAGPAYVTKRFGYRPRGGTGFGVRLLVDWLSGRAS